MASTRASGVPRNPTQTLQASRRKRARGRAGHRPSRAPGTQARRRVRRRPLIAPSITSRTRRVTASWIDFRKGSERCLQSRGGLEALRQPGFRRIANASATLVSLPDGGSYCRAIMNRSFGLAGTGSYQECGDPRPGPCLSPPPAFMSMAPLALPGRWRTSYDAGRRRLLPLPDPSDRRDPAYALCRQMFAQKRERVCLNDRRNDLATRAVPEASTVSISRHRPHSTFRKSDPARTAPETRRVVNRRTQ